MSDFGLIGIQSIDYHRNGVAGNGFTVAIFKARKNVRYLAIRRPDDGGVNCFVLDLDQAAKGRIDFGYNSWRGDNFAAEADSLVKSKGTEDEKRLWIQFNE